MNSLNYTIKIHPFRQKTILLQLTLAIGLPFGLLIIFLIAVQAYEALILIGLLFLISTILISLLYGNYTLKYTINEEGISCVPDTKQKKLNQRMNHLNQIVGVLTKNLTLSGIGQLNQSNQSQFFTWSQIKHITKEGNHYLIKNKFNQTLILSYPNELETEIENILNNQRKGLPHD